MNNHPFVTLVMPVRNEAAFIERSLKSVLAQDYQPHLMEIVVADGMSDDNTRDVIRAMQEDHLNLKLMDNPGRTAATGLNVALREAKGEVIVRVDGHCEIASDYISRCVQHLLWDDVDGVGGAIETIGETLSAQAIALAMSSFFGVGGAAFRVVKHQTLLVDTVAFPAYTRRAIETAGPFDEELVRNQDDEYNYRLRKLGGRILLASDVHSRYYSRSSLRCLWRQYFQYGYWKVRVMQKHLGQMRPRQFAPPIFVAALLVALILLPLFEIDKYLAGLVLGSYAIANLTASVLTARGQNWRLLPLLPFTFGTLHLSYGFGFLVGLVRFWNRWGSNGSRPNLSSKLLKNRFGVRRQA